MKLYLCSTSALELTRYLRSTNGEEGLMGTAMRKKPLMDAISTVHGIDELDNTAQSWLEHAGSPLHALVGNRTDGTKTKRLVTHVYSGPIPYGAMLNLGHNVCMSAPRFTFMQVATQFDLIDTVRVGMELCGTYSQWRLDPMRMGDPYYQEYVENRACTFNLPPAMRLKHALSFVERLNRHRGAVGARAALRWVTGGSASPMETATYLLLCLPKRLGGYGLPKPLLNPKLIVSNPNGTVERYPDLFWQGADIDVEYNSDSDHSGEWARYRDSKREIELTVANIKVLPLTRPQLMNASEFDAFAQGLRRMLGIRPRPTSLEWEYRRGELRQRLLSSWE